MGTRGLKWSAVGVASLLLVAVGAHLAWEQQRHRLWTPVGTVRIGMTQEEVRAVLGPGGKRRILEEAWIFSGDVVEVAYDADRRVKGAYLSTPDATMTAIPRPSLFEHVRSWLDGKREE